MDLVTCPECGQPADVEWRSDVASTDGPVELAKIRCTQWHHFLMPAEQIAPLGAARVPPADRRVRIGAR
jgi:sarcosine oxidase delta subunit